MANKTFFSELGVQPHGYVGVEEGEELSISPKTSWHKTKATVPTLELGLAIGTEYIHKHFATKIQIEIIVPKIHASIHRLLSTNPIASFVFTVHNSIHKQHYLDKWNATFHWDASRYLDTPYKFRLAETPVWDKCHDPSIIPGDPGSGTPGSTPGISGMHNDLGGIQGGVPEEYYHLTLYERNKLAAMTQGSMTYVSQYKPDPNNSGDGWVNSETNILKMYYNTIFNDVSVDHSSKADEVDGGYF